MRAQALQRMVVDALHLPPELAALVEVIEGEPGDLCGAGTLLLPDGTPLPIVLDDIVDELTVKYLRPMLRAQGVDDPEAYSLGWQEEDR